MSREDRPPLGAASGISPEDAPTVSFESSAPPSLAAAATRIESWVSEWSESATVPHAAWQRWRSILTLTECRRQAPADPPLLSVVIGPTGAGKSTLLNALWGASLSRAGAVRPCTQRPLVVGSAEALASLQHDPFLRAAFDKDPLLEPEYRQHDLASWGKEPRHYAVGDTPDFDSVEEAHHRASEQLRTRADRVLLVVNPDKYADRSVWDTVEELIPLGNLVGCVFNKAPAAGSAGSAADDCASLLAQHGLPKPVVVPRQEIAPDALLPLDAAAQQQVKEWLIPADIAAVRAQLLDSLNRYEKTLRQSDITPFVERLMQARGQRQKQIERFQEELPARIARELPLKLDDALRHQLLERFNAEVEKIDFLRRPRQWVTDSWRTVWRVVSFSKEDPAATETPLDTAAWMAQAYHERFLEFSLRIVSELRDGLTVAAAGFPFLELSPPNEAELLPHLESVFKDLEGAILEESEKIAEGLPFLKRFGFYGSQVTVHAVALLVFVKTGGLSGTEVAIQGLSSPLLAKVVGTLISEGEASALEGRLSERYQTALRDKIMSWLSEVEGEHAQHQAQLADLDTWQTLCRDWESDESKHSPKHSPKHNHDKGGAHGSANPS